MESGKLNISKRKLDNTQNTSDIKKRKIESHAVSILDLSDCVLLVLFKYLDSSSLYSLGKTCQHFKRVVRDESNWIRVDARYSSNTAEKTCYYIDNLHKRSTHLLLSAPQRSSALPLDYVFFRALTLENLRILALEHQLIDGANHPLKSFPPQLEELSLRHVFITHSRRFFPFSSEAMRNLRVLLLDHCKTPSVTMLPAISKFPNLEILSLYMCKRVSCDNFGDISLAGRFGFQKLAIADLRFCNLGDHFIKSFYKSKSLQELYFQAYGSTYRLERVERLLDLANGAPKQEPFYLSEDEDNDDRDLQRLHRRFGDFKDNSYSMQPIYNDSFSDYFDVEPSNAKNKRPTSFLYRNPYDECSCGFADGFWDNHGYVSMNGVKTDSYIEQTEEIQKLKGKLKLESIKSATIRMQRGQLPLYLICSDEDLKSPKDYPEATPKNKDQRWLFQREPKNDYEIAMYEHACRTPFKLVFTDPPSNETCVTYYPINPDYGEPLVISYPTVFVLNTAENPAGTSYYDVQILPMEPDMVVEDLKLPIEAEIVFEDLCLHLSQFKEESNTRHKMDTIFAKICYKSIEDAENYFIDCFAHWIKNRKNVVDSKLIRETLENLVSHGKHFDETKRRQYLHSVVTRLVAAGFFLADVDLTADQQAPGPSGLPSIPRIKIEDSDSSDEDEPAIPKTRKKENSPQRKNSDCCDNVWQEPGPSGINSKSKGKRARPKEEEIVKKLEDCFDDVKENHHMDEAGPSDAGLKSPKNEEVEKRVKKDDNPRVQRIRLCMNDVDEERSVALKRLSLRGYGDITDGVFECLQHLKLELLDVTRTNVTKKGVFEFIAHNPQCHVVHETACVCKPRLHF